MPLNVFPNPSIAGNQTVGARRKTENTGTWEEKPLPPAVSLQCPLLTKLLTPCQRKGGTEDPDQFSQVKKWSLNLGPKATNC